MASITKHDAGWRVFVFRHGIRATKVCATKREAQAWALAKEAELDKLTSGMQPSELIILAARPSQGKTALALNLMENVAMRGGHPVAMFSLEMSKESLLQRLVASVAQIDAHKFRTGHLSRQD